MPSKDPRTLFERRKEWTARKHMILEQYVVPAAAKLKTFAKEELFLVDGYAGQGDYDGEKAGSTHCMVQAARKVRAGGGNAKVIACEPDSDRFQKLSANLKDAVDEGIVVLFNQTHSNSINQIKLIAKDEPMLVFLDPHKPRELLLDKDLQPWLSRPRTDVLGIFMANGACRQAAFLASKSIPSETEATLTSMLGPNWRKAVSEEAATELFSKAIESSKAYAGFYRLRKRDRMSFAYVVFGASSSHHGMKLLSDAVARDRHLLANFDEKKAKSQDSLFGEEESIKAQRDHIQNLISFVRPFLEENPNLTGQQLMIEMHREKLRAKLLFGEYIERDYTLAKRIIQG